MTRLGIIEAYANGGGIAKDDRERTCRLLESDAADRDVLAGLLERRGLAGKPKKLEGGKDEK